MKKLLCSLLALAMLISLVPAAFADDTTTETEMEYSGITVEYNTDKSTLKANDIVSSISYAQTNDFWKFHSASLTLNSDSKVSSMRLLIETKVDDWAAFEIYVPKAGKYDVIIKHGLMKKNTYATDNANMWILPLIDPDTGKEYVKDKITAVLNDSEFEPLNSEPIDFYDSTALNNKTGDPVSVGTYSFPTAGKYLVVYKAMEASVYNNNTTLAYINPKDITLDGVEGDGTNAIPMTLPVSADKTELVVGSADNATAQMTAKAYMSDGSAVTEECTVSYTSSDNNIATVDESGLVTATGYGTATITATAEISGYTVSGSKEITVNAEGVSIEYDVGHLSALIYEADVTRNEAVRQTTYDNTDGFYAFYDANFDKNDVADRQVRPAGDIEKGTGNLRLVTNRAVAYEVYIPMAGTYTMEMKNGVANAKANPGEVKVYLSTATELSENGGIYKSVGTASIDKITASLGNYIGKYSCHDENADENFSTVVSSPNKITGFEIPEAGYYTIAFYAESCYGSVGNFTLTNGTGVTLPMPAMIKLGADELEVGGTTTAEVIKYLSDGDPVAEEDVEISDIASSNADVVTVDENGNVKAKGVGTATLSATVTYNGTPEKLTREVTVVGEDATEEVVDAEITFAATSNVGGDGITVTVPDFDYVIGQPNSDIPAGTSITLTATGVGGYEFRGWKRGSESDGVMISSAETFTFPLFTNTVITAIYEADTAETEASVEFYNYNGQFIESKPVNSQPFSALKPAEKDNPTLTGHNFSFWTRDGKNAVGENDIFEALTRVVAMFTVDTKTYAIDIGDGITGADDGNYAYDKELVLSANGKGTWYVNNKPVAYGDKYTHYVYGKANITFTAGESSGAPILSLDTEATDGSRMISYDANDAEIVEVGILFGSGTPTIGSFDNGKAASKHTGKNISGQFTATGYDGTSTGARGYLIYNDNGTYRVIYAN